MTSAEFAIGKGPDDIVFLVKQSTIRYYGKDGVTDPSNSIHVVNAKNEVVEGVTWSGKMVGADYMVTMILPEGYTGGYSIVVPPNSYSDYAGNANLDYRFDNPTMKPDFLITDTQVDSYNTQNGWITNDSTPTWQLAAGQPSTTKVLIRSEDGTIQEVEIKDNQFQLPITTPLSDGKHSFEFSYIYSNQMEAKEVQSPWSEPFTFTVDSKAYIIKDDFDSIHLDHSQYDKAIYNLLVQDDPTGGNDKTQMDVWNNFRVSADEGSKDVLDISELLNLKEVDESNVSEFLSVTYREGEKGANQHTILMIDRDGAGTDYQATQLIEFKDVTTSLEQLLQNNQIIYG